MSDANWSHKLRELGMQGLQIVSLDILSYDYAQARIITVGLSRTRIIEIVTAHPDYTLDQISKELYKR